MFDFNTTKKAPKLFLNETDGTVAKDYASIEKVDNSSRAGTNLKDVVEGMDDPKVTEKDVPSITKLHQESKPQPGTNKPADSSSSSSAGSSKAGTIAAILTALGVGAGIVAWYMNGHPGLDLKKLQDFKLPPLPNLPF